MNIGGNISEADQRHVSDGFLGRAGSVERWEVRSNISTVNVITFQDTNFSAKTLHKRLGIILKQICVKFAFEVYSRGSLSFYMVHRIEICQITKIY